ncbi:MAG: hypothetical protein HYR62_02070 [Actinobacteria bacterium]|nr:hypothetical protein [Actinomycetota bacterium]MBI3687270.1 hypothetical protein [Actinomycetota bacterium]
MTSAEDSCVETLTNHAERMGRISEATRVAIAVAVRVTDEALAPAMRAIALHLLAADRSAWEPDVNGKPCLDGEIGQVVTILAAGRAVMPAWATLCRGIDEHSPALRRAALLALTGADPLGRPEPLPATVQALREAGWVTEATAYVVATALGGAVAERRLALRLLAEHADDLLYGDATLVEVPQHLLDPVLVELMPAHSSRVQRHRNWHRILDQVRLLRHWSRVHSFGGDGDLATRSFEVWLDEALLVAAREPHPAAGLGVTS